MVIERNKKGQFIKGHGLIPREYKKGRENPRWREDITYMHLHEWIREQKGRANHCQWCVDPKGRFEWANIDHKYKRNLEDYVSLCSSCHVKYDKKCRE